MVPGVQGVLSLSQCVSWLSAPITNNWENQLIKREGLFCLTVLEVQVLDPFALLLLGSWRGSTPQWEHMVFLTGREAKESEEGMGQPLVT
jgi:hypothetical protein